MKKTWIVLTGVLLMGCASQKAFVKFQSETKAAKVEQDKTNQNIINDIMRAGQSINVIANVLNEKEARISKLEIASKPKRVYNKASEFNRKDGSTWRRFTEGDASGYEISRGTEAPRVIYDTK